MLAPAAARAHHVVWVDFGSLNLGAWPTGNGNRPPPASDAGNEGHLFP